MINDEFDSFMGYSKYDKKVIKQIIETVLQKKTLKNEFDAFEFG